MFCIYISLLLLLCTETSQGVTLGKEEESILRSLISEFEKDPTNDRFDHVVKVTILPGNRRTYWTIQELCGFRYFFEIFSGRRDIVVLRNRDTETEGAVKVLHGLQSSFFWIDKFKFLQASHNELGATLTAPSLPTQMTVW